MTVRHVLDGIKVLVLGGDFEPAAPATATVEIQATGIRDLGPIDHELVVVETFVLRPRDADPNAVVTLGQRVLCTPQEFEDHALGLWCDNTSADAPFRADLGKLFAGLIERRRLEVVHWRLGHGRKTNEKHDTWKCSFHDDHFGKARLGVEWSIASTIAA